MSSKYTTMIPLAMTVQKTSFIIVWKVVGLLVILKNITRGLKRLLKRTKKTISLAQAKDVVPGPNCMLKSLWG